MATHQLYDGGPANSGIQRMQWPAYPFSASDPALAAMDVSAHVGSRFGLLQRVLDFKNDFALQRYFKNNAVAQGDVMNLLLLPPTLLLLGLYAEVENPQGNATTYLQPPVAAAPTTSTVGGTLAAATYFYKVTAINANGETIGSNEVSVTTTGTTSSNTITWAAVAGATGYKVYRGTAAGGENAYYTVGAVTTYTDTNAGSTAASPPASNTAVSSNNALTLTLATTGGVSFGSAVAIDQTVASANFSPPGAAWVNGTAGSNVSLANARYIGTQPDMVTATLTAMGTQSLAGFGNLRLNLEAIVIDIGEHKATNF